MSGVGSERYWWHWENLRREWRDLDGLLLLLPALLTLLGGLAIRSAQLNTGGTDALPHWLLGGLGVAMVLAIARWPYERLLSIHWFLYGIVNLSLIAVLAVGTTAMGAERWIAIGGISIQPSEFAKIGVIITLAAMLHERPIQHPADILRAVWVVVPPWILIFLQPNLGTALIFAAIATGMLYWGGTPLGWIVLLVSPLVSAVVFHLSIPLWLAWVVGMGIVAWVSLPRVRAIATIVALVLNLIAAEIGNLIWGLLHDYQKQRLILFLDPSQDPLGGGYHLIQSQIAIGAGQLWGQGLTKGTQTQLNFIPEQHTDFIFSAIGEELGFVGGMLVLLAFLGVCWRLLAIASMARDNFGSLLAIGVFSMILFQACVNIGMNVGVAPVTGIPLPWLSMGRSALLANFLAIALVESVAAHRRTIKF